LDITLSRRSLECGPSIFISCWSVDICAGRQQNLDQLGIALCYRNLKCGTLSFISKSIRVISSGQEKQDKNRVIHLQCTWEEIFHEYFDSRHLNREKGMRSVLSDPFEKVLAVLYGQHIVRREVYDKFEIL